MSSFLLLLPLSFGLEKSAANWLLLPLVLPPRSPLAIACNFIQKLLGLIYFQREFRYDVTFLYFVLFV